MIIWLRHFFDLYKRPKDYDNFLEQLEQIDEVGKVIEISQDVLHWDTHHIVRCISIKEKENGTI